MEIMGWKKIFVAVVLGIAGTFLLTQKRVFPSEVYFTSIEIKGQIIHAIGECRESIDIAVSDITSKEIINALIKAQDRGVRIRIVVDRRRALRKGLLSDQYKNKKFAIKVWVQKGIMNNNFAIFDCKLLKTGSYSWSENAGRLSRNNAIFTDETKLLVTYQKEFDCLFHEGVTPDIKEFVTVYGEKAGMSGEKSASGTLKDAGAEGRVIVSKYGVIIKETHDGYINMDFDEFNNVFGVASDLSDEQKEAMWNGCVGKRIKWRGKVNYIGWGLVTGWMLGVTHGDTGVEIKLNADNKAHFSGVKYGNTVIYTGKLHSRVTRMFPYKLEDGDILEHENIAPEPLNSSDFGANPYIMPVSQGPKKIFLVETFEDLDTVFGKESALSDAQKDETWEKYKGKYVSWTGQIAYKNLNVAAGMRIGMTQKEKGDVEVKTGMAKKDKILKFQEGETVLYTGKLAERCGGNSPYVLEDGDIITLK